MRAREPDRDGAIVRGGVRVGFEVFEGPAGAPTVLLLPSWAIVNMRQWKAQVPFLARECRVVTVEVRGNGDADRPHDPAAHTDAEAVAAILGLPDASIVEKPAEPLGPGAERADIVVVLGDDAAGATDGADSGTGSTDTTAG